MAFPVSETIIFGDDRMPNDRNFFSPPAAHHAPIQGQRLRILLLLGLALLPPVAARAQVPALFDVAPNGKLSVLDNPAAADAWRITVDHGALARAPRDLALTLPTGERVRAQRVAVEQRGPGDLAWRGRSTDGGEVTLTLSRGYVLGRVTTATDTWELATHRDGGQVLIHLDPGAFGACGNAFADHEPPQLPPAAAPPRASFGLETTNDPVDGVDVLVVYTEQARDGAGGVAAIEATAQAAVDASNTAFVNSNMAIRFRLAHAALVDRAESNATADLQWVSTDPSVQALRDIYRADMVGLLVESAGPGLCGLARLLGNQNAAAFAPNAYQVTQRDCAVGKLTFAHEHGHNMGLQHNPQAGAPPSQAFRPFAYGHFVSQTKLGPFRTVMAAASSPCGAGCRRESHFSNPDVDLFGTPTGIANQRDNARTSDISAPSVTNWRRRFPAPAPCADCVRFDTTPVSSFPGQDSAIGPAESIDAGATFAVGGNRWLRTDTTFTIASTTVLELEFLSTQEGEIQGIGFETGDTLTNGRLFQLFGTQIWPGAIQDFNTYDVSQVGTYATLSIPVGQFYTGNGFRMVFANDQDVGNANNTVFFRNVRLVDSSPPNQPPVAAFTSSCSRLQCTFDGRGSSDPDGTITRYRWIFPGGQVREGATAAFFMPGYSSHSVRLEVTDDDGATASTSRFVTPIQAVTTPRRGAWFNPDRSGHGIDFFVNGAGNYTLVWYTYLADGTPIWYISDTRPLDTAVWTAPLFRTSWNGSGASLTQVGEVRLDFSGNQTAWFSWFLDGLPGGERFQFLFGGGGRSGLWFPPSDSGWGVQINEDGSTFYTTVSFYVGSQPRWVVGQVPASSSPTISVPVSWLTGQGLCPACSGATPVVDQAAGSLMLRIMPGASSGTVGTSISPPTGVDWLRNNLPISRLAN